MVPIYEQGNGRGIGHNLKSFLERFEQICRQHTDRGRAKSFAFIFYDFNDRAIKKILRDQGAFARLDRLSGNALSLFYLHTGTHQAIEKFNNEFARRLGLEQLSPPCVVHFKVTERGIEDISAVLLEHADLVHGLNELYEVIERYIAENKQDPRFALKHLRWIEGAAKFVAKEVAQEALKKAFEYVRF